MALALAPLEDGVLRDVAEQEKAARGVPDWPLHWGEASGHLFERGAEGAPEVEARIVSDDAAGALGRRGLAGAPRTWGARTATAARTSTPTAIRTSRRRTESGRLIGGCPGARELHPPEDACCGRRHRRS